MTTRQPLGMATSLKDVDDAMRKLRQKLATTAPKKSAPCATASGTPNSEIQVDDHDAAEVPLRPASALSQEATAILQQIENFDLFAHVQKKVSTTPAPPRSSGDKPLAVRPSGRIVTPPSVDASDRSKRLARGAEESVSSGCGSNDPIPADAPMMSDDVIAGGFPSGGTSANPSIGIDEHGHPGTCYRVLPPGRTTERAHGLDESSGGGVGPTRQRSWEPTSVFVESLRPGRTFVYFDFLLECIRRDQQLV